METSDREGMFGLTRPGRSSCAILYLSFTSVCGLANADVPVLQRRVGGVGCLKEHSLANP